MANKPRIPLPSPHRVYEDFQPNSEEEETLEHRVLRIYLPGFTREQIRITFVNFSRTVDVYGERVIDIGNNRWSRFNQSYPVPPNCEIEKLQAKFSGGILTITMPTKLVSQQPPIKAQDKVTFPSKQEEPKPDRKAQEDFPPKYTPSRVEEPKPEKAQEKIPQKYTATGLREERDKRTVSPERGEERGLKALVTPEPIKESRPQKGQDEIESRKPRDEKHEKSLFEMEEKPALKIVPRKPKDEKQPDKDQEEIKAKATLSPTIPRSKQADDEKASESRKPDKMFEVKEIRTKKEGPKTPEKEKEESTRSSEDIIGIIGKGIKQVSDSASQVVTRISERKWNEEDKPTLVNMGAAVLVIVALGAYVSYRIASSGRA